MTQRHKTVKDSDSGRAAYYYSDEVRNLLRTLQEATRATPRGGPSVYIPPAGGDAAEANYNHFVFGQRGSGKSSLLRHLQRRTEDEGRVAVWTESGNLLRASVSRCIGKRSPRSNASCP
jgi:hypothetical protein